MSETSAKGAALIETTDPHPPPESAVGGRGRTEAEAFCDFALAEVASPRKLREGGALDVAGGCGLLSHFLALRGVRASLIDPAAPEEMRRDDLEDIKA